MQEKFLLTFLLNFDLRVRVQERLRSKKHRRGSNKILLESIKNFVAAEKRNELVIFVLV